MTQDCLGEGFRLLCRAFHFAQYITLVTPLTSIPLVLLAQSHLVENKQSRLPERLERLWC
jgi:hypothetical protein